MTAITEEVFTIKKINTFFKIIKIVTFKMKHLVTLSIIYILIVSKSKANIPIVLLDGSSNDLKRMEKLQGKYKNVYIKYIDDFVIKKGYFWIESSKQNVTSIENLLKKHKPKSIIYQTTSLHDTLRFKNNYSRVSMKINHENKREVLKNDINFQSNFLHYVIISKYMLVNHRNLTLNQCPKPSDLYSIFKEANISILASDLTKNDLSNYYKDNNSLIYHENIKLNGFLIDLSTYKYLIQNNFIKYKYQIKNKKFVKCIRNRRRRKRLLRRKRKWFSNCI